MCQTQEKKKRTLSIKQGTNAFASGAQVVTCNLHYPRASIFDCFNITISAFSVQFGAVTTSYVAISVVNPNLTALCTGELED